MLSPRITQIAIAIGEMFRQPKRVGDAAFAFLIRVVQMLQRRIFPICQQPQKIAGIASAGDQQDLLDARIHQRLDRIVDHRLVVNRQQMLVRDFGQRKQTAAGTPGERRRLS